MGGIGLAALVVGAAVGAERVHRLIDARDGLPGDAVYAVGVDPIGRLWVGGGFGVAVLDGSRVERVDPEQLRFRFEAVAVCERSVWAAAHEHGVWRVDGEVAIPVLDPAGAPLVDARDLACDGVDKVWIAGGSRLLRGDERGVASVAPPAMAAEGVGSVADDGGVILVGTGAGVWRATADRFDRLFDARDVVDTWTDGVTVAALERVTRLLMFDGQTARPVFSLRARGISLQERKGTLWLGTDTHLVGVRADGTSSAIGPGSVNAGGELAVGPEGELIAATFAGLYVFPEPDTRVFTFRDGLPVDHARFVVDTAAGLFASTWFGGVVIQPASRAPQAEPLLLYGRASVREAEVALAAADVAVAPMDGAIVRSWACVAGDGTVWATGAQEKDDRYLGTAIGWWDGARFHWTPVEPAGAWVRGCTPDKHGDVWFWAGREHFLARDRRVERREGGGLEGDLLGASLGRDGTIHHARDNKWCTIAPAARGALGATSCRELSTGPVYDVLELDDGSVIAATGHDGLLIGGPGRSFEPLPYAGSFVSDEFMKLAPSPRGGVWAVGASERVRLVRDGSGWKEGERLLAWHGVQGAGATSIVELPNGEIWLSSMAGITQIPVSSRGAVPETSPPFLSSVEVDGRLLSQAEVRRGEVTGDRWRVTVGTASFRDPDRRRFRARVGETGEWTMPSASPVFELFGLAAGAHALEIQTSIDGLAWVGLAAPVLLRVPLAWYQRWELWLLVSSMSWVVAWAWQRERGRRAVALERQRLRIAMDLHDELGSGLGSVGILAGLAADHGVPAASGREAAAEITAIASALGDALGDIVWSLRPQSASLGALTARLREQARRLVPGPTPALVLDLDVPSEPVDPGVCRNVHRVAIEALYNAVKHAGASTITLRLRVQGRGYLLQVVDDGRGLPADVGAASGLGMRSMQRRAEDIGGRLRVRGEPGRGTTIELVFQSESTGESR